MPTCFIYVHAIHLLYILPIRVIGRAGLVFRNRLLLCVRVSEHPLNLRVSLLFPSSPKLFLWEGSSFEGGLPFEGDSLVPFQKLYLWVSVLGSSWSTYFISESPTFIFTNNLWRASLNHLPNFVMPTPWFQAGIKHYRASCWDGLKPQILVIILTAVNSLLT